MPLGNVGFRGSKSLLPSVARALAQAYNSGNQEVSPGISRLIVVLDVTAVTATPALTLKIQGYDPYADKYFDLLTSAVIATAVTTVFLLGPGVTTAANLAVASPLPPVYRVIVTHGDTDSATYTVTALECY